MYSGIFDSHAHYDDPKYNEDRDSLLPRLHSEGISYIMNIGADLDTSRNSVALAEQYDFVWSTVGVHPHCAHEVQDGYLDELEALAASGRVRAVGEIGLDYFYETTHAEEQKRVFREQLALAKKLGLPVVVHDRDAHADTLEILTEVKPRGVVHCYSGSAEMAMQLVGLGLYVGFTGVVTFKNARRALEAAAAVPLDRLLIETDCPYLAPEPHRGTRCDSSMLRFVVDKLAELRGISPEQLVAVTADNAKRLYGIS